MGAISPLYHNIYYPLLDFHVNTVTRFSLRDKRLCDITEVEIMESTVPHLPNVICKQRYSLKQSLHYCGCSD